MVRKHDSRDDFRCPHCGARVRARAKFCRECGASEESGWGEEGNEDSTGYGEDEDFDYDDYLRREFPEHAPRRSAKESANRLFMILIVAVLCLAFLIWAFGRF